MKTLRPPALFCRLRSKDIPAVMALERQCFSHPWSETQLRNAFAQAHFAAYGLRQGPALPAYAICYQILDTMELLNIAVHPSRRRRGYACYLLESLLQESRKIGITRASLDVRTSNIPARALYEKLGFIQTGVRRQYYTDTGEDALLYDRLLS